MGMKRWKTKLTRGLSALLSALLVVNSTAPAFGYFAEKNGLKTVAGNEGEAISEEADWISTYPNGIFALKDHTVHVYEDGGEKKITVYRLGGRDGDAAVSIALIPAVATMDEEGENGNYANAAGTADFRVRVEDYVDLGNEDQDNEDATESDAEEATDSDANEQMKRSDITYTEIFSESDDPYEAMFVDLEFQDGEWVKDILISAVDDEEHEPEELLLVLAVDSTGAEILEAANRTTVVVNDDEEALDSEMGFEVRSVRVDKADGEAVLTLVRTGGVQYVSQVDYFTEDGTAEAGRDYVESEGSVGFACGLGEAEIRIQLIDDGIESLDEADDVTFYVHLTDPKAGTIEETAAVLEVSLFNSVTAKGRNLATMTYMPEAEDVSSEVAVSDAPVADPAGSEMVSGEVVRSDVAEVEAKTVEVAPGETESNPRARTFTYTAPMQFGANQGNWKPYAVIAGASNLSNTAQYDNANGYASSSALLGQGVSGSVWFWRYGNTVESKQDKERTKMTFQSGNWTMQTDNTIQASLKIDRLYDWYDRLSYQIYFESDRSSIPRKHNAVYGYIGNYNSGNAGEYSDSYGDSASGAQNYINDQLSAGKIVFNNAGQPVGSLQSLKNKAFAIGGVSGSNGTKTITDTINLEAAANSGGLDFSRLKEHNYLYFMVETSADRDIFGKIQIQSAVLRRQAFNTNPVVRVHTADDQMLEEARTSGSEAQKAAAESLISRKLAPSVSLVDGGTDGRGNLYIGSQINVTQNTTSAVYRPHGQVRLIDKADNYVANSANLNGGSGILRLHFSNDAIRTTKDTQFFVDMAMDRKQQVLFSYAGSIDVDNDGTKTDAEAAAIQADLNAKLANATMVCGTYTEDAAYGTHKYYKDQEYSIADVLTNNSGKERYEAASVTNLKSINFHMDSEDVILFHGQMYAGNEDIPVSVNELEFTTLEFQFYDVSCLALVRDMELTSISSVSQYVDYNGNGKLDIVYHPETGRFETVAVNGVKDFYIGSLETGSYTASDLEPVVVDGKVYQQLLLVRYNMIPRSLRVPEGADPGETCLVVPNFTTVVTNEEENARQSKEMLGYRAIDGKESMEQRIYTEAASIGYVAFPVGGDYSPPRYVERSGGYEVQWEPEWHGSLMVPFENPENIALDNTLMPQNGYVVADCPDEINGYLGSMHGNDTFALTLHYDNEVSDTILGTFRLQPEMGSITMTQEEAGAIGVDRTLKEVDTPSNLSDSDPEIKLPTINVGLGPADLVMDGDTVGFSVGVPIFSKTWYNYYAKNPENENTGNEGDDGATEGDSTDEDTQDGRNDKTPKYSKTSAELGGWLPKAASDTVNLYREGLGNLGNNSIRKQLKDAVRRGTDMSNSGAGTDTDTVTYGTNYAKPFKKQTAKSFNIVTNFTFLWKYSNLSHKFEFYQAAAFVHIGGSVKLSVYPEPIHVVYVFVAFSADVSLGTGLEMTEYMNDNGTRGSKVAFMGIDLGADFAIEGGVGAGVDLLYAELYLSFTVSASGSFLSPEADASFDQFSTSGALAFRFLLLFLDYQMDLIGYEFGYDKARDGDNWYFKWHALGDSFGDEVVTFSLRDDMEEVEERYEAHGMTISWPESRMDEQRIYSPEDNMPNPKLRSFPIAGVPFEVSGYHSSVTAYSLVESLSSGSDYQLLTWTDKNGENHNYMLYMLKLKKSEDNDQGMQDSTLVLSELVSKSSSGNQGLGLVHPYGDIGKESYLVIDLGDDGNPDPTGDLDFSAYIDEAGQLSVTWVSYVDDGILTASASDAAAEMSRNTVVKHTVINLAQNEQSGSTNHRVSIVYDMGSSDGYRFQPAAVDEKVSVFAEAYHYDEDELAERKETHEAYYEMEHGGSADVDDTEGQGNPLAGAYAALNYDIDRVYGNYSMLNISVATASDGLASDVSASDTSVSDAESWKTYRFDMGENWKKNHTRIDSMAMMPAESEETDTYYLAYATTGTVVTEDADEKQIVKHLYLQKLTIDESGVPDPGKPILLRTLVDNDKDSSKDGVYEESKLVEPYENPYLVNLNFLHGALEADENGVSENEDFFLFGMNGNTYVMNEESLKVLLEGESGTAAIQPFFERRMYLDESGNQVQEADVRSDVSIGADGDGNISAVYTDTVPNTVNNALYICKYDPTIGGWGAPVMLAMNHMQVYEDSQSNDWDNEETRENYYIEKTVNGTTYAGDKFVFEEPVIALGQKEELLVVTRGVLTNLTTASYENLRGETVTEYVPAMENGRMVSDTGYYAIAYGIGEQKISEASLTFHQYNFSKGANLTPYIRFRNTGDTAIRASEAQPAVVKLMAAKVERNDAGDVTTVNAPVELMKWEVKEHILAGAEFDSRGEFVDGLLPTAEPLPEGIENMTLYFTVSEDASYMEAAEGKAFGWSSLDEGKEGVSYYNVGSRAEVSFGFLTVGAEGHTTITPMARSLGQTVTTYVDMEIINSGSEDAEGLKVKVEYSNSKNADGTRIWYPVDTGVTGSTLAAGSEWKLETAAANARIRSAADGIFRFIREGDEGSDVTTLSAGTGIHVSGTMTLPAEYYDESDTTKAMNLRFTVLCENEEYTTENNTRYRSLEAASLFEVPGVMNLTLGNTVEIPIGIRTTRRGLEPAVTVRELTGIGGEVRKTLFSSLHYNPETRVLTMSPGMLGSGIIRIADINTGSFTDILFTVNAEGVNIATTNPALEFKTGTTRWRDKPYYEGIMDALPYLNDTAVGGKNNIVTFTTFADNIDLYFKGTIRVWIDGNDFGYLKTRYTSDNLFNPVLINFKNHELKECEVTIEVVGDEAEFDKYVEFYGARGVDSGLLQGDTIRDQKDTAKPMIIYGKSIPADASIDKDAVITFPVYFIDNRGIQAATVDGKSVDGYFAGARGAVKTLELSGNTGHTLRVRDSAGLEVMEELDVMWFGGGGTLTEESWPHYKAAVDTSDPENPKLSISPDAGNSGVKVTVVRLDLSDNRETKELVVADSWDGTSGLDAGGGSVSLTADGLYLVRVTNAAGLEQTIPVWVTEVPDMTVNAVIRRLPDENRLYFMVQCGDGVKANYFLYGSEDEELDGEDVLLKQSELASNRVSGTVAIPEKRYPYYILKAVPEDADETDAVISTYCMLAKLTEVTFNVEDVVWRTKFTPEQDEFVVRVPRYDENGNDYEISSTEITGFMLATGSEDAYVRITQAVDSTDGATAVVTVTENGVTNIYTFRFINDGCTCSLTEVIIDMDTAWTISAQEDQIRIPVHVVTDRGTCQIEDHNEMDLDYDMEVIEGKEIASAEGSFLTVRDAGNVTFFVTAYSPNHKPVTSKAVTITVTKKQKPTDGDDQEDDPEHDKDNSNDRNGSYESVFLPEIAPDYVRRQKLYLSNGTMAANCWVQVNGIWYYAGADGHAKTGWFYDLKNGFWYFLDQGTGAMKTGWHWEPQDGYWYYLHPVNGEMLVGWQNINETYYFLNPVSTEMTWYLEDGQWKFSGTKARPYGSMYANEQTPDGAFVGSDGSRIGSKC